MKPRLIIRLVVCSIVCIFSLSGCVSQSTYNDLLDKFNTSEANTISLQTRISSITDELSDTKKALTDVQAKLNLYSDRLGITVYSDVQPNYSKAPSAPITLVNNPIAKDPTWQQLLTFLSSDKTDSLTYVAGVFMCGGFAEMIHNNAESAGIKAALVTIDFADGTLGHALNAFKTSDRGLVYIDCTGEGLQLLQPRVNQVSPSSWDKIAYLSKNKQYGVIAIVNNNSFDYSFYEKEQDKHNIYEQKLAAYNADLNSFNAEIDGKRYYTGTPEWSRIKQLEGSLTQQYNDLQSLRDSLMVTWEPLGTVSRIELWW